MHSIARENLQNYLYSYKETPKEPGLTVVHDAHQQQQLRKLQQTERALRNLKEVVHRKVAFAVQANVTYDGSLEDESPFYQKTISFEKNDFLHIYKRYSHDWWLGRVVAAKTTIGFIPTARRLSRLKEIQTEDEVKEKKEKKRGKRLVPTQSDIWEWPCPYTVVPSTRPILMIGPTNQNSRLTELMHAAVRSAIVKQFGNRIRRLKSDIGAKFHTKLEYDASERELRLITALAEDLHLVLLECSNINSPADLVGINLAPIIIQFKITNRKILTKLLKKSGMSHGNELAAADMLNSLTKDQVDLIIEDNGLPGATQKICHFLEEYWNALHPTTPLMEARIMKMRA